MLSWVEIRQRKTNTVWSHTWTLRKIIGEFFFWSFVYSLRVKISLPGRTLDSIPIPCTTRSLWMSKLNLTPIKRQKFQGKNCLLCLTYHRGLPVLFSFWPLGTNLPTYWCIWDICRLPPSSCSAYRDRFQVHPSKQQQSGLPATQFIHTHAIVLLIKRSEFSSQFSISYIPDENE